MIGYNVYKATTRIYAARRRTASAHRPGPRDRGATAPDVPRSRARVHRRPRRTNTSAVGTCLPLSAASHSPRGLAYTPIDDRPASRSSPERLPASPAHPVSMPPPRCCDASCCAYSHRASATSSCGCDARMRDTYDSSLSSSSWWAEDGVGLQTEPESDSIAIISWSSHACSSAEGRPQWVASGPKWS